MPAIVIGSSMRLHVRMIGSADHSPLLLIQGLGMQMTDWPGTLLAALSQHHRLVLFDNRDYGRSSPCGPAIDPALRESDYPFAPVAPERAPYSLYDMAADALSLLDALRIDSAHVMGFSMGGMIAQIMAAQWPDRVRSLVSLMSSGGQPVLLDDMPGAQFLARMIVHVPDRARLIRRMVAAQSAWTGPHHVIDPRIVVRRLELGYRRCYRPAAIHRQALAYASAGDRSSLLRCIRCPSLVIHGGADPIIPLAFAEAAARLIPGASLMVLPDAAHDLHPAVVPRLSAAILAHLAVAAPIRIRSDVV
ncbi:alpha/beta fold hydrolase [Dongia deserti]|uniref:alpha/beta fold hydrolase n=1 Tax=Dongia deserti TaxID=2268030 RepID=UPI000E65AB38|nr:alpha/beta hydrolase [Dongia deserti]